MFCFLDVKTWVLTSASVGNSHVLWFLFLDPELLGVGSLLKKYIALLCTHIGDILPVATSIASTGRRHFAEVSRVIEGDLTGNLILFTLLIVCVAGPG